MNKTEIYNKLQEAYNKQFEHVEHITIPQQLSDPYDVENKPKEVKKIKKKVKPLRITTADYINFDTAMNVGKELMNCDKKRIIGFYIILSINTGLRISDVLSITWEDVLKSDANDGTKFIKIYEGKTGKQRVIQLNKNLTNAIDKIKASAPNDISRNIFLSQKKSVFTIQQINRILKKVFSVQAKHHNISSHSLRKTFGRRVYENQNESEKALVYLSELFCHSSMAITRRYLGIRQEELNDIYMNL